MRPWLAIGIILASVGSASAQQCAPGTWRQAAPLPQSRSEVTAASDGNAVYVVGGMASDPATDLLAVFRYDPATDQWSTVARLDHALNHTGAVVLDNRLYVVGGYHGRTNAPLARV